MTTAEGGMLVTGREDLAARARLMRAHGMTTLSFERAKGHATSYDVVELGYNYRLDEMSAALGRVQISRLDELLTKRQRVAGWYADQFFYNQKVT